MTQRAELTIQTQFESSIKLLDVQLNGQLGPWHCLLMSILLGNYINVSGEILLGRSFLSSRECFMSCQFYPQNTFDVNKSLQTRIIVVVT